MGDNRIAEIWYLALTDISRIRRIQYFRDKGDISSLYNGTENLEDMKHYFTEKECEMIRDPVWKEKAVILSEDMKNRNIQYCFIDKKGFPESLSEIPDPPCGLFYKGTLPKANLFSVGIIGARMCTEYGRRIAQELGKRLAECGIGVVSGMALGIDSASFAGGLSAGGMNFAVLGSGCDVCYPVSSRNLYDQIPEKGAVISEYLPGTEPKPFYFPERNRLISGLSDVLAVVEARDKSGSLITVDCALDQGRDIYAVPGRMGDKTSTGCNRLIHQGASILYDIDLFLDEMAELAKAKDKWHRSIETVSSNNFMRPPLEKDEQLVYSCLDLHPKNVFVLLEETGLPLDCLLAALAGLSEKRLSEEAMRNAYVRTRISS